MEPKIDKKDLSEALSLSERFAKGGKLYPEGIGISYKPQSEFVQCGIVNGIQYSVHFFPSPRYGQKKVRIVKGDRRRVKLSQNGKNNFHVMEGRSRWMVPLDEIVGQKESISTENLSGLVAKISQDTTGKDLFQIANKLSKKLGKQEDSRESHSYTFKTNLNNHKYKITNFITPERHGYPERESIYIQGPDISLNINEGSWKIDIKNTDEYRIDVTKLEKLKQDLQQILKREEIKPEFKKTNSLGTKLNHMFHKFFH